MLSQITDNMIVFPKAVQAITNENLKSLHHWPLCGESTGDQWVPHTKGQ